MKFKIDHDLHIHSYLSVCSQIPEQNKENIFKYAKDNNLRQICITDHYWDSAIDDVSNWYSTQNFEHVSKILPLPQDEETEFLFGVETEMDKNFRIGIPKKRFNDFDFVIIPTTHLHMGGITIDAEDRKDNNKIAKAWVDRLDALLNLDIPFKKTGIAHLACKLLNNKSHQDYLQTLELLKREDLERLFSKAATLGCGIEINQSDMDFTDDEADVVLRMFRIAKNCGCKFYLGSDAHSPEKFKQSKEVFERAINLLGLTESDKFHIEK